MKEIEIKAKLHEEDAVMKKLKSLGCVFEPTMIQNDVVYAEHVDSLEKFRLSNDIFLRIRVKSAAKNPENLKILFTLKKRLANDLDALEHEVEISSKEEMEQAILLMGYKEAVRINKTRVITHHNGCEICIDNVQGLGAFIEMEKLTQDGDSETIQEELFSFFESLGISRADRVMTGYDTLILQKRYAEK